jgi:uncharacterized protein involved in outer membrane biogenesis
MITISAGVALYTIIGFFALPPLIKSLLVKQVSTRLHRQVDVREIRINPFLLTVGVTGFSIKDRNSNEPFITFETLFLDLEAVSLFKRGPVLREISLGTPFVRIVRSEDSSYNFSDLLNEFTAKNPDTAAAPPKPLLFSLNNIRIENGRIDIDDRPKNGRHAVTDIMISIPFISNLPYYLDTYVQPAFQAKFNGTPVVLAGKTKPFLDSRETSLDIDITNFEIPKYLEYLPMEIKFKMPSGSLDTKLSLSFTQYRDKAPALILRGTLALNKLSVRDLHSDPLIDLPLFIITIDSADIFVKRIMFKSILLQSPDLFVRREKTGRLNFQSVIPKKESLSPADTLAEETDKQSAPPERALQIEAAELRVTDGKVTFRDDATDKPFQASLKIPSLSIAQTNVDLDKRTIVVGQIASKKGAIAVRRDSDGSVNLAKLTAVPTPAAATAPSASNVSPRSAPTAAPATSPWVVTLQRLNLDQYSVMVEDQVPSPAATFLADPIAITAANISTAQNAKGTASIRMTLNKSSLFTASGSVRIEPLSATLALDLKDLDLVQLQPYFTDRLKITVTSGNISTRGTLTVETNADRALGVGFTGDAALTNLVTLDKTLSEDFLKWNSLSLQGINAGNSPPHTDINMIALFNFYSRLIVNADGSLNVQDIMVRPPVPAEQNRAEPVSTAQPAAAPPAQPARVTISAITMEGGSVDFSDRFIRPNYSAKLTELSGKISGLSSEESQQADVDLRGKLGSGAPFVITGKINPLSTDLFMDLLVDFKDIELGPMTPYSAKYAGYTIEKGKLTLQLKYLIDKRKLKAQNKVLLDQFTFGEKVDSPTATKLPVRFAVSLLKDRNGLIDLDLPVTGSLDDPQFSIWSMIGKILTNLLTKAATAPFALLGSLVGGGQDLSHIEYDYGVVAVSAAGEQRLKTLAKILYERPSLKLEVIGKSDAERDEEALRQEQFQRKIRAQKLNDVLKKGATASLDIVSVESNEYEKYLTQAYKKETFPKPRNLLGFAKDLPVPEMERLILSHIHITDDDLKQLAQQRAQGVKEYLVASKIEPERIFLVTAPSQTSEAKNDKLKSSRVDLLLK